MKNDTHPEMNTVKVVCACGNEFETLSTAKDISIEVCSACHPFFTGKQKIVDTAGRVDKFKAAQAAAEKHKKEQASKKKKPKKAEKEDDSKEEKKDDK